MSVHAPNAARAKRYKALLPRNIAIAEEENMNFIYIYTPIATDSFIESLLDKRLSCLRQEIIILREITHLHECIALLRSCVSACIK